MKFDMILNNYLIDQSNKRIRIDRWSHDKFEKVLRSASPANVKLYLLI